MGNWSKPTLPDQYSDFLDALVARDVDSGTMFLVDPTNPPVGVIRFNRSLNLFQEWNGSSWVNKVLAQAGGGTGGGSFPTLGTMASQNANNVNITGGSINGMNLVRANGELQSATHLRINGQIVNGTSQIVLTDSVGKIPAINSGYFSNLDGSQLSNLNASALGFGTVYRDRLGSGAAGDGSRVLADNGTWIQSKQIGGGMVEVVRNDFAMGSAETDRDFVIPWGGPMPSGTNKISIILDGGNFQLNSSDRGPFTLTITITGVNTFHVKRMMQGNDGNLESMAFGYQAFHHATQV